MKTYNVILAQEDDGRLKMHTLKLDAENDGEAYNLAKEHFPEEYWFILEVEEFKENETQ